ncbi:hypothetical protein K1719_012566 [Acacia pycnantha]|nr:hypothetical protein K1719_012566 [Acacia pycnantha]
MQMIVTVEEDNYSWWWRMARIRSKKRKKKKEIEHNTQNVTLAVQLHFHAPHPSMSQRGFGSSRYSSFHITLFSAFLFISRFVLNLELSHVHTSASVKVFCIAILPFYICFPIRDLLNCYNNLTFPGEMAIVPDCNLQKRLCLMLIFCFGIVLVISINEDGSNLLEFKASLVDPQNYLHNWNSSDSTPCNWKGVHCDDSMVTSVNLHQLNLSGALSPSICNLPRLVELNVSKNFISGPIPVDFVNCRSLEILDLCTNRFHEELLIPFSKITTLRKLYLCENYMHGGVPEEFGNLTSLEELVIYTNNLTGRIPTSIVELGNCTNAIEIDLSENRLSGNIPQELGQISSLRLLHLFENLLEGEIPQELGKLKLLWNLDLSINNLAGTIPLVFQNLTYMEDLQLFDNQLQGKIPPYLGSNSNLTVLDISMNNLVGMIPPHLCRNQKLQFLSLGSNKLLGNIPDDLKMCKPLVQLMLGDNQLTGSFPVELNELHNLSALELHQNRFSGLIDHEIGRLINLKRLLLSDNYFVGYLPPEIGNLTQLVAFNISSNFLSGSIPHELGNCIKLQRLDLSRNEFTGDLPDDIGKLVNLELLKLSDNRLSRTIPSALGDLKRLTDLELGGNLFVGSIPFHLGQLAALQIALNLSYNKLSGTIPDSLGSLQMLEGLYLNGNQLVGEIPASIGDLPSLLVCNVSNNKLVGVIPDTPAFRKMNFTNFAGNNGLCRVGSYYCHPSHTPIWTSDGSSKKKIVSIVSAVVGFVSLIFIVCICWAMKRRSPSFVSIEGQSKPQVLDNYYFPKEGFTYQDLLGATSNFSEALVIGRGACGTVYKAVLTDGEVIAVKKLNSRGEGANVDRSFLAEISTLGKIRHRNIVKLFGFCCHEDSNILLYEFMENGSLGEQLHSDPDTCILGWSSRYKIALGAAEGLCYLHYDCKPQIIHRDIKSNNILLDEVYQAHVGDFGLAKLVDFSYSKSMSAVAGSYGYIAPEYAYTMKVTEKCDIYSFGVVLLELITGRSPVQPLEQGGDLVTWVRRSIQATSPLNRPTMKEVIAMLIDAREYVNNSPLTPTSESPLGEDASSKGDLEL